MVNLSAHETVREKVSEGMTQPVPALFERDLSLGEPQAPKVGNLVNLVAGVRRCGKTFRLYQEMRALLAMGVPRSQMLYFNFDDERILPAPDGLLDDVITTYEAMNPAALQGCYLFFDEIQEVPKWGSFLRRLVDTRRATIYVTGSSSRMLSSEMPTEFRGRSITRELFPLSFREYCRINGMQGLPDSGSDLKEGAAQQAQLRYLLDEYLVRGGFPAVVNLSKADAFQVLQGYVSQTVARDIIEREGLANARVAQMFVRRCIASSACELSMNKVANQFKALGQGVARETLSTLLDYYEESYLVFRLGDFSRSLASNPRRADKVYAVDPGLEAAFSPATTADVGQRLETAVFDALRRRCGYLRQGSLSRLIVKHDSQSHEVDFAVGDVLVGEPLDLIQVSIDLDNEKTLNRELSALDAAMAALDRDESWIVTLDTQDEIARAGGTVHVVPAWHWLLD